jgi:hypothetical protein
MKNFANIIDIHASFGIIKLEIVGGSGYDVVFKIKTEKSTI